MNLLTDIAPTIVQELVVNGGITINHRGTRPDHGYMVGDSGKEVVINDFGSLTISEAIKTVQTYLVDKLIHVLMPCHYYGFWLEDGKLYMDVTTNVKDKYFAIALGDLHNQLAVFDVEQRQSIYLK